MHDSSTLIKEKKRKKLKLTHYNIAYLADQRVVEERSAVVHIVPYTSHDADTHRAARTVHRQVPGGNRKRMEENW